MAQKKVSKKIHHSQPKPKPNSKAHYLIFVGLSLPIAISIFALGRAGESMEQSFALGDEQDVNVTLPRELADKADAFKLSQLAHREAQGGSRAAERDLSQIKDEIKTTENERNKIKDIIKQAKKDFEREADLHEISASQYEAFESLQRSRNEAVAEKNTFLNTLKDRKKESEKVLRIAKNSEKSSDNERKRRKNILEKSVDVYKAETCQERRRGVIGSIGAAVGGAVSTIGNELIDVTFRSDDTEDQRELKKILKKALECRGQVIDRPGEPVPQASALPSDDGAE